ncbi:hypothetical protein NDU88_000633 [Pleurodeles waltl]|uniref:Uncharacterized protein n=1 Tax=Pleurodeles waltl TaxID=8319 RepID=A0AAV7R6A1_PLEWA|nr:hypothetical protein NDU88_000633 [Pleurodeles waltl]
MQALDGAWDHSSKCVHRGERNRQQGRVAVWQVSSGRYAFVRPRRLIPLADGRCSSDADMQFGTVHACWDGDLRCLQQGTGSLGRVAPTSSPVQWLQPTGCGGPYPRAISAN